MTTYLPRCADKAIEKALRLFGAVLIQGPKWCGKTTTALQFASSSLSLTNPAGDFAARQLAQLDPAAAIMGDSPRLIDEWQEAPKLWDAVRFECDRRRERGLYLLTGSATPRDAEQPMHSGTGRFARISLDTMTLQELGISSGSVSLAKLLDGSAPQAGIGHLDGLAGIADAVCRGGWPETVGLSTPDAMAVADAYVDNVCESDASRVDGVRRDPEKVRSLLVSLARNESTLAGQKATLVDVEGEMSRSTAARYLDALRRILVVSDIPAWNPALRTPVRLRDRAKHHLADPSLVVSLLGASPESLVADPKTLGLLFESLALHDLRVYAHACDARLFHYHDADDLEVDAIVSRRNGGWLPVEVKLGPAQVPDAVESLTRLERKMVEHGEHAPVAKCVLIGYGMPLHMKDDGVLVIPIDMLGA